MHTAMSYNVIPSEQFGPTPPEVLPSEMRGLYSIRKISKLPFIAV